MSKSEFLTADELGDNRKYGTLAWAIDQLGTTFMFWNGHEHTKKAWEIFWADWSKKNERQENVTGGYTEDKVKAFRHEN